jgi:pyruvate-formate lyase
MPTTTAPPVSLDALSEMGEWMAVGFYEGSELPWPRAYGLAFRRLYENMPIVLAAGRTLLPSESLPHARNAESHREWTAVSLLCDFNHDSGLRINRQLIEGKKAEFPQYAAAIDALVADLAPRLMRFGGYTHNNPDIRRVVNEGFDAMEAALDAELVAAETDGDQEALPLLQALKDYAIGVRAFHTRATAAIRAAADGADGEEKARLTRIADSFAHGFLNPARTFLEGFLAVHFTWLLDGCDSLGRLDQALGDLYERELAAGTLDLTEARMLLDELWQAFERFNGWNIQIGGYTPDGRDGANALTLECIAACARNHIRRPNVALRITRQTPEATLEAALHALADGSGRPALYNDDLYVETLHRLPLGLSLEDAREIGFGGCTETMIAGLSNVGSLEGEINLAKALELALHDGYDPVVKRQVGPHTGLFATFTTFDEVLTAAKRQIQYMTDAFVALNKPALTQRFTQGDPKLYRTFFTRDCVRRRKSFEAGGARYNWAVVSYQGIANIIDSLAAIQHVVYTGAEVTAAELLAALDTNFAENDDLRQRLQAAPKFGNDLPAVDDLGREIIGFAWDCLLQHETPRGGRYLPSCILFVTYLGAGQRVGATPDGRLAFAALTDSVGPAQGRDTQGPTAMLNSIAKLPLAKAVGTPVLNLRFQKAVMATPTGRQAMAALLRAFFAQGGMQVQLSVISKEEMLAAQQAPEQFRDLIVRIGGYSEYFTVLPKELQDSVIARIEYGL